MSPTRKSMFVFAALGLVGLSGTAFALWPRGDDGAYRSAGDAIQIALVQAREPAPEPGGVMEVGGLTDGYVHTVRAPPEPYDAIPFGDDGEQAVYVPGDGSQTYDAPTARVMTSEPPTGTPLGQARVTVSNPLAFGLDEPQPDYAAARRERLARLDGRQMAVPVTAPPADPEMFY